MITIGVATFWLANVQVSRASRFWVTLLGAALIIIGVN